MISIEDCVALSGLTKEEVLAIAEHEHVPEIVAAALASQLLCRANGCDQIEDMIRDDIRASLHRRDLAHARELLAVLAHFARTHPHVPPA